MAENPSELRSEGNALYKKGELFKGMIRQFLALCRRIPNKCWHSYLLGESNVKFPYFSQCDWFRFGPLMRFNRREATVLTILTTFQKYEEAAQLMPDDSNPLGNPSAAQFKIGDYILCISTAEKALDP
jgi:hypothetical protein